MTEAEDAEEKRLIAVHNERLKLAATYVNGLAIALFAVGSIAPAISLLMSNVTATGGLVAVVCAAASTALHYVASRILKGLRA